MIRRCSCWIRNGNHCISGCCSVNDNLPDVRVAAERHKNPAKPCRDLILDRSCAIHAIGSLFGYFGQEFRRRVDHFKPITSSQFVDLLVCYPDNGFRCQWTVDQEPVDPSTYFRRYLSLHQHIADSILKLWPICLFPVSHESMLQIHDFLHLSI